MKLPNLNVLQCYRPAGGYTSFPGMGTTADPIGGGGPGAPGGYQGPPFSSGGARPGMKTDAYDPSLLWLTPILLIIHMQELSAIISHRRIKN